MMVYSVNIRRGSYYSNIFSSLAQIVAMMNVTELGIRHTPGVCGGRARIRDTRIPVWTIIEAKNAGASDLELLHDFPSLTTEDITNALRYYQGHQAEIEQDLREQETEKL